MEGDVVSGSKNNNAGTGAGKLTDVVRTPQSSTFSKVGVGALGVSTNSNSDSLPLVLCGFDMLATSCCSPQVRTVEQETGNVGGRKGRRSSRLHFFSRKKGARFGGGRSWGWPIGVGPRVWLGAQSLHSGILKVQLLWRLLIPFAPFSVFCFELGFTTGFCSVQAGQAACRVIKAVRCRCTAYVVVLCLVIHPLRSVWEINCGIV